jgi:hypothetical protein
MRYYHLVIFLFCFGQYYSQYNTEFLNFEKTGRSVSINSEYELGSNGLYNSFFNKFMFGGYLDTDFKKSSSKKMKELNVMGANLNYDISAFFGRNSKYSYLIGFKDQRTANASYTHDFYDLAMYGNKPFLNETKNFSGTNINFLRFQELKVGFIWHKIDTTAKAGISVSILKGQQLFQINANQGSSLFTNSDGTELVFNSQFNMTLSDTSRGASRLGYAGIGASADIFFETPYKSKYGKESILTVNANNIGFLHWFDNSMKYSSDSVFTYTGYQINNLIDLQDSTLAAINADTIIKNTTNARKESFNVNIPTNLIIINKIVFTDKFAWSIGFRYLFNSNFKPYLFSEAEYKLSPKFTGALHLGYGGYSRLNVGLAFTYNTPGWFFRFGSNSIQGFILPKQSFGQGAFISVAKKFKK